MKIHMTSDDIYLENTQVDNEYFQLNLQLYVLQMKSNVINRVDIS